MDSPHTARVRVTWAGALRFDSGRPDGPTARLDGTGETGQGPLDGLMSALASCSASDVLIILTQQRAAVDRLTVDVIGERADTLSRHLRRIVLQYTIVGADIDRMDAERAVDHALSKYGSVKSSLDPMIRIVCIVTVNGEIGDAFLPGLSSTEDDPPATSAP